MKILIIILYLALLGCSKDIGHQCKWNNCPYKGVTDYNNAVKAYTECEEGSDCYIIDILHLQYPNDNYDELENKLLK